jgi:hypothetical protein
MELKAKQLGKLLDILFMIQKLKVAKNLDKKQITSIKFDITYLVC